MAKYKEIEFAKDYNRSFAEFKEDFADNWVFLKVPSDEREAELKKAFKIATSQNGKLQTTTKESKETDADTSK